MDFDYYFKKYDEEYGFNDSELCGFEIGFGAGQQSKQEEVNKLQVQIDELQKWIDNAVDYADGVHSENWQETINTMLHILKGE